MEHGYENLLAEISDSLNTCKESVKAISALASDIDNSEPKEQAYVNIVKVYALSAIYSAYLRCKNIPEGAPFKKSVQKIKDAMKRLQDGEGIKK